VPGGGDLSGADGERQLSGSRRADLQSGIGIYLPEGDDYGDVLGEGFIQQYVDVQLHGDGQRHAASDLPQRLSCRDHESGAGDVSIHDEFNSDLHDTDSNRQLRAGADSGVQSAFGVGVPAGYDDGDVHGYGLVGEHGDVLIPGEHIQLLSAGRLD
jgi:hypothetical protein